MKRRKEEEGIEIYIYFWFGFKTSIQIVKGGILGFGEGDNKMSEILGAD